MKVNSNKSSQDILRKTYTWGEMIAEEGVYRALGHSDIIRLIVLHDIGNTLKHVLYFSKSELQPASSIWHGCTFIKVDDATVNFSINE